MTSPFPRLTNPIQRNPHSTIWRRTWKAWSVDIVISATPVTKTKTFSFLANVEGLVARRNGQNWATKRQNSLKVPRGRERTRSDRRNEREFPDKEPRLWGVGWGQRKVPWQWTPPRPSGVVLSTVWNVFAEKQKLKIDCNFQFSMS